MKCGCFGISKVDAFGVLIGTVANLHVVNVFVCLFLNFFSNIGFARL